MQLTVSWVVAGVAAVSARGLTGFARANMGLRGAWPVLLWAALDGAAGLCAVLLLRRAARGESAVAPRLAVWGLVAASSAFNWAHAPARPGAPEAFALMPVIAAVLFEFSLRETRRVAGRADRRAQAALARAGFADPVVAAEVPRQAQVLSLTATLAILDYATPRAAEQALAGLITPAPADGQALAATAPGFEGNGHRPGPVRLNGQPVLERVRAARGQAGAAHLVDMATALVEQARDQGVALSQAELARQLRARGFTIANGWLRWLTTVTGLSHDGDPR